MVGRTGGKCCGSEMTGEVCDDGERMGLLHKKMFSMIALLWIKDRLLVTT